MGGVYQTPFEDSDLSGLPTADPGNGQPWLDASGAIIVGASALDFGTNWGDIGGTLSDQADLVDALSTKADSTAVTIALEGKADKATTLAGYGITDALALSGGTLTGPLAGTSLTLSGGITLTSAGAKVDFGTQQAWIIYGGETGLLKVGSATSDIRATFGKYVSVPANGYVSFYDGNAMTSSAEMARIVRGSSTQLNVQAPLTAFKNLAGTADAPITASTLSTLANGLTVYGNVSTIGGNRSVVLADTGAGGVLYLTSGVRFAPSGGDANLTDVGLYRSSAGVLEINNGTVGTLRDFTCRTITATGGVAVGPVTFAVLNATTPALGAGEWRVTDRGNRRAYPDGTNWRWVGDDSIIS